MNYYYSYHFGLFTLVPSERLLLRNGEPLSPPPKAFDLLCVLVENAGKLLSRDYLLRAVWTEQEVEEGRVDSTISEIKKLLGGGKNEFIENVRKSGRTFEGGYRFVAEVISKEETPEPLVVPCPFPGLLAFDTEDAEYFFGREADLQQLIKKLSDTNFLVVIGPSGFGKSSLVRAGLVRELRKGTIAGSDRWRIRVFQPGAQPLRQLALQLLELTTADQSGHLIEPLINRLQTDSLAIEELLSEYFAAHPECQRALWIVDQFEEVFTQCRDEVERAQFISSLQSLMLASGGRNLVLLTLRADYYLGVLSRQEKAFRDLTQLIAAHQLPIGPPGDDDLRQAMTGPAKLVGLSYEQGLVDEILKDLKNQAGALPLLAHTLRELFDRREGEQLTLAAYRRTGGVEGSIAKRADATYKRFSPEWQQITRRILVRLSEMVQIGNVLGRARQRLTLKELTLRPEDRSSVEEVVKNLADARLLTTNRDERTGEVLVEVAHDALIRNWPLLVEWLWEDRVALRVHRRLLHDAAMWNEKPNEDILYRRSVLAEATRLLQKRPELFDDVERKFLEASERVEEREFRSTRMRRWVVRGGIVGVFLAIVLGCLAYFVVQQWREAQRQRDLAASLKLVAESTQQQQIDPEVSLLLAIEAARLRLTTQTEAALRQALLAPSVRAIFNGHTAQVVSAVPSTDGQYVISAGADNTARIWNPLTGESIATLAGHSDWVNWAAFSPDGKLVVTGSSDKTARIWDVATSQTLATLSGHEGRINNAVFSRDGNRIVTAGGDKTARIWDARTGQELLTLKGHREHLNSAVFSPDGQLVVTGSKDTTARVWDSSSGKPLALLEGHTASVLSAAFSQDGRFVTTASVDKSARVWKVGAWQTTLELRGHTDAVQDSQFSPDGKWIVTASKDGSARIWKAQTAQLIAELHGHRSGVNTAVFSPDGRLVISASGDGTARVWQVRYPENNSILKGHTDATYSAIFSPDGSRIVTSSKDQTARVWEVSTQQQVLLLRHPKAVQNAVFNPDGALIATANEDGRARLWDARTGDLVKELVGHSELVHAIAFNSDGSLVATASRDRTARIWNTHTGECLRVLDGHKLDVTTVEFSKDGSQVLTASRDNTVRLWDTTTWESYEWKIGTGWINGAMFSSDNKYVVAACGDQTARVWNPLSHQIVVVLRGHEQWVNYAEFSPSGALVVTASGDQTTRIWDLSSGRTLIQLSTYENTVMGASFSPDGKLVATASTDGRAQIYSCQVCGATGKELLQLAEARARRGLTSEEKDRFLKLQ